eukprot:XP_013986414.1 PREDICTED: VPS10 domain-containing receptor SorCS1-like [Salmo salar]
MQREDHIGYDKSVRTPAKASMVILILTKLNDFHLGSVTESTLWRSTDNGSTYERMNDKVGSKTMLSYLYVCSSNKRKGMDLERGDWKSKCTKVQTCERTGRGQETMATEIMVLTDPEFESSVLINSDEGASYQKYRLSFYILSPLFYPTQMDWALAYSHDQKDLSPRTMPQDYLT